MQCWQVFSLLAVVASVGAMECSKDQTMMKTEWSCPLHRVGFTPECPATTCKRILEFNPWAEDGKYWFRMPTENVIFEAYCDMTSGGYMMVIRIPKGYVPEARNATNPTHWPWRPQSFTDVLFNAVEMNEGHLDWIMNKNKNYLGAYKNRAWRFWDELNVEKIRISLIKDMKIVKDLEFDARYVNHHDWFNFRRLIKSNPGWKHLSWTDLNEWDNRMTSPIMWLNYNSVVTTKSWRSFEILKSVPVEAENCSPTVGWMFAVDQWRSGTRCSFERTFNGMHVLYSKGKTATTFNNVNTNENWDIADSFVIMLK